MPGTFVGIGLNSPRISLGASGFMSKVSRCEEPPLCHTRMQEMSLPVPARSTLSSVMPSEPSDPRRSRSRRPKRLVWLFTFISLNDCTRTLSSSTAPKIHLRGPAAAPALWLPPDRLFAALQRQDTVTPCADIAPRSLHPPDALSSAPTPHAHSRPS